MTVQFYDLKVPDPSHPDYLCMWVHNGSIVVEVKVGDMPAPWRGLGATVNGNFSASFDGHLSPSKCWYAMHLTNGASVHMPGVSPLRGQLIVGKIGAVVTAHKHAGPLTEGASFWWKWDPESHAP